jgi:AcrR family transcriptional regulator
MDLQCDRTRRLAIAVVDGFGAVQSGAEHVLWSRRSSDRESRRPRIATMAKNAVGRGSAEETRERVIQAAIATVIDVGYYKASSNAIARNAGVTWGSINHLFGSREQLMLDVVNYLATRLEERLARAVIEGETLEDRLWHVLGALSSHYEHHD